MKYQKINVCYRIDGKRKEFCSDLELLNENNWKVTVSDRPYTQKLPWSGIDNDIHEEEEIKYFQFDMALA